MFRKSFRLLAVAIVIFLPILLYILYSNWTAPPEKIRLAGGTPGGVYDLVASRLARQIQQKTGIEVEVVATSGSLENLNLIRSGKVDFAFYQPSTWEWLGNSSIASGDLPPGQSDAATVANLYSQVLHLIVHNDSNIKRPEQLRNKRVAVGFPGSGDYAMAKLLLREYKLSFDDVDAKHLSFVEIRSQMESGELDAAITCLGTSAPILAELFAADNCRLISIPHAKALVVKNFSLRIHEIPQGLYSADPDRPEFKITTVATGAQLLTRTTMHTGLVSEITLLATNPDFARQNGFSELFTEGRDFAKLQPEFPIHPGARAVYSPNFDMGQFESWEALYSLIASGLIGGFLLFRRVKELRSQSQEHRLDNYIRSLLEIERRQVHLDNDAGEDEILELQKLLDEVTFLRQDALQELNAYELNEDRAADCFLSMCAHLTAKINAKVSRQRLEQLVERVLEKKSDD